jgi:transposase-like protein
MRDSDEHYVIDLCDRVLTLEAERQYRGFDFLRGSSRTPLPVDAYYRAKALVIEYHERQHSEPVAHFDKRHTCSGCNRAEQRQRYDELRRTEIPRQGIRLIELDYSMFQHTGRKRLKRDTAEDKAVIRKKLSAVLGLTPLVMSGPFLR